MKRFVLIIGICCGIVSAVCAASASPSGGVAVGHAAYSAQISPFARDIIYLHFKDGVEPRLRLKAVFSHPTPECQKVRLDYMPFERGDYVELEPGLVKGFDLAADFYSETHQEHHLATLDEMKFFAAENLPRPKKLAWSFAVLKGYAGGPEDLATKCAGNTVNFEVYDTDGNFVRELLPAPLPIPLRRHLYFVVGYGESAP